MRTQLVNPVRKGMFKKSMWRNPPMKSKFGMPDSDYNAPTSKKSESTLKKEITKILGKVKGEPKMSKKRKRKGTKKRKHTPKKKSPPKKKRGTKKKSGTKKRHVPKKKRGTSKRKGTYYKLSGSKIKKAKVKPMPKGFMINPFISSMKNPFIKTSNPHKRRKKGAFKMKLKNPIGMIKTAVKDIMEVLPETAYAGAGYIGLNVVVNLIPVTQVKDNAMIRIPSKLVLTLLLSAGANMLNKKAGKYVMLGGTLNAMQDFVDSINIAPLSNLLRAGTVQKSLPASTSGNISTTEEKPVEMFIDDSTISGLYDSGTDTDILG